MRYDGSQHVPEFFTGLMIMRPVIGAVVFSLAAAWLSAAAEVAPIPAAQLNRVARLIDAGEWAKAEQTVRQLIRTHPNDAAALNLLGVAAGKQGRIEEAERTFRKAVTVNPSLAAGWVNLSHLYKERSETGRAMSTLEEGLRHMPKNSHLLSQTAALLLEEGRLDEAMRRLDQAPQNARDIHYWEIAARVHLAAARYPEAEQDLLGIAQNQPDGVTLLRELAGVALKRGDAGKAREYLARALRVAPNAPELMYEFAQVCLQAKAAGDAVMVMRKANLMEPDRPEFIYFLGESLLNTADYHEALPYFERYVQLRPEDARGYLSLGWSLFLERRFPEAKQQFEQSLKLNPKQPDALYHLGMIAYETNDDAKAQQLFAQALEIAPQHARSHFGVGLVSARGRDFERARSEFEQAVRLDPDEPKFHYQLSQACARLGDTERARRELELYQEMQKKSEAPVNTSQQLSPREDQR